MSIPAYTPIYEPRQPSRREPNPPQEPTPDEQAMLRHYQNLRMDFDELEMFAATRRGKTAKELDKAIVLMKVGAKLIKRRLRAFGYVDCLKAKSVQQNEAK